jgi:hypothetical protein
VDFRDKDAFIVFKSVDEDAMTGIVGGHFHCYCEEDGKECECVIVEDQEVQLAYEVCGFCSGRGKYVNPNIDRNGISGETFREDPEFFHEYRSGMYDVPCKQCKGKRVMPVAADPKIQEAINRAEEEHHECAMEMYYERMAEIRMGC